MGWNKLVTVTFAGTALLAVAVAGEIVLRKWSGQNERAVPPQEIVVENIAALRAADTTALQARTDVTVLGYHRRGDLGGGRFHFEPASQTPEDGGLTIAPASGTGRWLRVELASPNVRWFGAMGDGMADDTSALQMAIAGAGQTGQRGTVYVPRGTYRITASLTLGKGGPGLSKPIVIYGDGQASQIINAGPADNPTFALRGVSFWTLRDLLLTGSSANKNDGVWVARDANGNQCSRFTIENVITEMAGRGFVLQDTNTGVLRGCKHWSSSNANGAAIRPAVRAIDISHGLHLTGDFCNDISVYDFDCIVGGGWSPTACSILCDAKNANAIRVFGGTIEGSHQGPNQYGISFHNVQPFLIEGTFAENSKFRFENCRSGLIAAVDKGGNGGTLFTGRSIRCTMLGCSDDSLQIDADCERIMIINSDFDRASAVIIDRGRDTTFIGVSGQGALRPDKGIRTN